LFLYEKVTGRGALVLKGASTLLPTFSNTKHVKHQKETRKCHKTSEEDIGLVAANSCCNPSESRFYRTTENNLRYSIDSIQGISP